MGIVARLRRALGRRRAGAPAPLPAPGAARASSEGAAPGTASPPSARAASAPAAATPLRGLGEPPATPTDAGEAELDTLRGELVRELDRMAEGADGSGSFRRIAS